MYSNSFDSIDTIDNTDKTHALMTDLIYPVRE
jgi:hypothetical protein